ncbi:MAG: hypothetical protein KUL87_19750 [Pseudomonas sp.]|jgi:hypothetical protein|nr:hypothetical protein [Pseudomonas sp.]
MTSARTRFAKSSRTTAKALAQLQLFILAFSCAHAHGAEPATAKKYEVTTTTFSAPAEYYVMRVELNPNQTQWTLRENLEIPEAHQFSNGIVFVYYSHPDAPDAVWFSAGESPSVSGYRPAAWYAVADHGPIAYFAGKLNPIIPVNVASKPLDVTNLEGGNVIIGYGLLESSSSNVADAYQEMQNSHREKITVPVFNMPEIVGDYVQYCFTVTAVKKTLGCTGTECPIHATDTMRQ